MSTLDPKEAVVMRGYSPRLQGAQLLTLRFEDAAGVDTILAAGQVSDQHWVKFVLTWRPTASAFSGAGLLP